MHNYWYTSDTHFLHNAVNVMCKRGFSDGRAMDEYLIQEWNKLIKPGDFVRHLGDFAFRGSVYDTIRILGRLNGNIDLIIGNHEKLALKAYEAIKAGEFKNVTSKNFASIQTYLEVVDNEQRICLFHYPMRSWHWNYRGAWHLFGHEHGNYEPHNKSFDAGVDYSDRICGAKFRPLHFDEVKAFMDKQTTGSHHNMSDDKLESSQGVFNEACDEEK